MTREQEIMQMLKNLFGKFSDQLAGHRILLFGSRAKGRACPRSDFDLAVIGDEPLPLKDFYALSHELDALPTLYRFDWVDLARVSDSFRAAVLAQAEVIYEP